MNNLSKRKEVLLWSTYKSGGVDEETCTLSRPYTDFDEIVFVTTESSNGSGYASEWRYLTNHIVFNQDYCNSTYGHVIVNFKSTTSVWYDGSHQWLAKIYGVKY